MQHKRLLSLALVVAAALLGGGCSLGTSALPIDDDFSGDCNWPEKETAEASAGCADGHYHLLITRARTQEVSVSFDQSVDALTMEADAKLERGEIGGYGVGCWTGGDVSGPGPPGYFVAVSPDGAYLIGHDRGSGDDWVTLVSRGPGAVEMRRGTNTISIECVGGDGRTTIVLSVNGAEAAVASDPAGENDFGRIGFIALMSGDNTEVTFDNAAARELSDEEARKAAEKKPTPEESLTGLPLVDDFSEPSDLWATGEDKFVSLGYAGGAYRMLIKKPSPQWSYFKLDGSAAAVRVSASATKVSGSATSELGLLCYSSENEGYVFSVSPGGGWAIFKETRTDIVTVKDGASPEAFGGVGTAIEIEADCVGSSNGKSTLLELRVNGREVGRASDSFGLPSFSFLGVYGRDEVGRAELRFDDFAARELSGAETAAPGGSAQESEPEQNATSPSLLFEERFATKTPAWPQNQTGGSGTGYAAGGYRFVLQEPETGYVVDQDLSAKVERVRIDVDARQPAKGGAEQSYGVACKLDSKTGYSFEINGSDRSWSIMSLKAASADQLAYGFDSRAIRRAPATNHLRAECDARSGQTRLVFFVNGRKIGSAVDKNGVERFNSLALTATTISGRTTVIFDNLVARRG